MVSEHKVQPIHCPLCLQTLAEDGSGSWLHFTRHMEEIALAALPPVATSDVDSATDSDLNSNPDLVNVAGTKSSRGSLEKPHPASQSQRRGLLNIPQSPSQALEKGADMHPLPLLSEENIEIPVALIGAGMGSHFSSALFLEENNATPVPANPNPTSLDAVLDDIVRQNQLSEWLASPTRDIHDRLVHFSPSSEPEPYAPYLPSPPNPRSSHRTTSSMAMSMAPARIHQQPSNASTQPPSFYHYSDATPTETSISTGLASRFSGVPLLEENNGVLEQRVTQIQQPAFECCFWFLKCSYISNDQEEWATHCLSHFRGEEPPKSVQCPLCDQFQYTCDNGWTSWNQRMEHVGFHHSILGETLRASRPDFHLFQHLWQKRLIDDQDLEELKGGNHNLTCPPSNFVVTNGRRGREARGGRGHGHQHIGARRQNHNMYAPRPAPSGPD
jgi:hypothetical protein